VIEAGDRFGLGLETGEFDFARVAAGEGDFDGDVSLELQVVAVVDDAHAAAAELGEDLVGGDAERGAGAARSGLAGELR
jgi:hypothetical protein